MAHRRCLGALARHCRSLLSSTALESTRTPHLPSLDLLFIQEPLSQPVASSVFRCINPVGPIHARNLSSRSTNSSGDDEEEEEEEEDDDDDGEEEEEEENDEYEEEGEEGRSTSSASKCVVQRGKTEEEKAEEAAAIGYQVIAPLDESERPFKPWEPVFAVVQIGSHQFKVSNGDSIFTERLKFCEVNDKLILNKVLMMGSQTQTIIGRPMLPDAAVHAVVEEHALDAKVIIFKKKRRKNYRRTKGHRQELTKLRITDIQGIDKAETTAVAA